MGVSRRRPRTRTWTMISSASRVGLEGRSLMFESSLCGLPVCCRPGICVPVCVCLNLGNINYHVYRGPALSRHRSQTDEAQLRPGQSKAGLIFQVFPCFETRPRVCCLLLEFLYFCNFLLTLQRAKQSVHCTAINYLGTT